MFSCECTLSAIWCSTFKTKLAVATIIHGEFRYVIDCYYAMFQDFSACEKTMANDHATSLSKIK